ncbi:plasma membrane localization protein [Ascochyta rabiei]|uniref:plasma membrane localization protein n=1 Tax=Didymella rabiei TaxID=5454 RepID=UPI0018FF8A57|nr:plasma membrane localization protein [Ascochyta rabiei]UPX18168.1 plasma membrane localization protein [Ascochyta rabiei]
MNAARQACRPKHQVLVLKCYPKYNKQNVEVRANSSELAYLLYYASTRRSKLAKVTDFLDKRATSDVWKGRTGSVQVTLQIVRALIDKCPRDLPLYQHAVLRILRTILASSDVGMVEESVPVFAALCAHQDPASLAADVEYVRQYEAIVQLYAHFAAKHPPAAANQKAPQSWPVALRLRKAGLHALKAVAESESLGSETARQLALIVPVVLANMYADSAAFLARLEQRERDSDAHDKELALGRRKSLSAPARTSTNDEDERADPVAAEATTEAADRLAEEKVGVLALQALRNIFQGVNRGQLRLATSAVLAFIADNVKRPHAPGESWATKLMAIICAWAPVQDRYAILVAVVEALVRSPIVEADVERQLVLATIIDRLLSSTINFIGLSVMDVLVGLISHTLLLLQLGGPGSTVSPHHQQTTSVLSEERANGQPSPNNTGVVMELVSEPSHLRMQLLDVVRKCMADLATHVYYTDQVSDMIEAILSRLKPSPASTTTAEAIENPEEALDAVVTSGSLREKTHVDRFFSFETARITALEAVKAIIETANARRPDGSSASVARSRVGVSVWEGTQWLLRDPSGAVRKAYVDAVVTWLSLEKTRQDLRIVDNHRRKDSDHDKGGLTKRAVSNASQREKSPKPGRHSFLPLLHLAVYENALQFVDSEADYMLLHLLLSTLVERLGINAARSGLPMVMRLQEEIATVEEPTAKVRIGSLVHGYLWALSMALDFETSAIGRTVHNEITRRNNHGLWLKSIRVPPMPADRIDTPHPSLSQLPTSVVQSESLIPFDNRDALVEKMSEGYSSSLHSPPSSLPGSPGRSMSASSYSGLPTIHQPPTIETNNILSVPTLPYKVREDLLADWSREQCLAINTKGSSSASISGSKSGTQYTGHRGNFLGVRIPNGGLDSTGSSPDQSPRRAHSRPPSMAYGLVGRLASPQRRRSPSESGGNETPRSRSSLRSSVRVDDLKRALSGSGRAPRTSYSMRPPTRRDDDEETDSLVSAHSLSDASFTTTHEALARDRAAAQSSVSDDPGTPAATLTPRPLPANQDGSAQYFTTLNGDVIPPVPAIPADLRSDAPAPHIDFAQQQHPANGTPSHATSSANAGGAVSRSRSVKSGISRGRSGNRTHRGSEVAAAPVVDVGALLGSVGLDDDDGDDEGLSTSGEGLGRAPY